MHETQMLSQFIYCKIQKLLTEYIYANRKLYNDQLDNFYTTISVFMGFTDYSINNSDKLIYLHRY